MPTSAQLQAESYWGREIVTAEITWLGDQLCETTGRPRDAFGSKGNSAHLRGAHRSQEWIQKSRYCTSRTYTVQGGLTATQARHIAGVDFTPGSAAEMIAQCRRIYAAMLAGKLDEVLEFFGNLDGDQRVDGWDNDDDEPATSDSSHLWHWHLTIDRRHCADRSLMERILAIALGLEDDMDQKDPLKYPVAGDPNGNLGFFVQDLKVLRNVFMLDARKPQVMQKPEAGSALDRLLKMADALPAVAAQLAALSGKDFVDEPAIVDGILAGLGGKDLTDVATTLRAAFGDERAAELGALLATTGS